MSNPTYGSGDYTDPQSGYAAGSTGATDPYATTDPYGTDAPYDPNAPAAGGYATTGTYTTDTYATDLGSGGDSPSTKDVAKGEAAATKDVAKDEAAAVKDTAVDAGKQVAGTAKQEAANVAGEAKEQAKTLVSAATSQLKEQASSQQGKLATSLRGFTDQLQGVGQGQPLEAGPLNDLVQQAASRANQFVSRLENSEPADVLDDLRRFARRRPVVFLALSGLAGVVVGRIARGAVAANTSVDSPSPARALGDTAGPSYTTNVDYAAPTSTYGAYTDAPAAGYTPEATYPTETTYGNETTVGYADRGDAVR